MDGRNHNARRGTWRKLWLVPAAAVLFLAFATGGTVLGKYVASRTENELPTAAAFYFTSDLLKEASEAASYTWPTDSTSISVELRNYEDSLRYSECDVSYTVTIQEKDSSTVTETKAKDDSGDDLKLSGSRSSTQTVTFTDLTPGTTYVVTAASSPYKEELTAEFTIPAASAAIDLSVVDSSASAVAEVTVTVVKGGSIKISWPYGVVPDFTDSIFDAAEISYTGSYSAGYAVISFSNNSSYTITFLKQNLSSYYTDEDSYVLGTYTGCFSVERVD